MVPAFLEWRPMVLRVRARVCVRCPRRVWAGHGEARKEKRGGSEGVSTLPSCTLVFFSFSSKKRHARTRETASESPTRSCPLFLYMPGGYSAGTVARCAARAIYAALRERQTGTRASIGFSRALAHFSLPLPLPLSAFAVAAVAVGSKAASVAKGGGILTKLGLLGAGAATWAASSSSSSPPKAPAPALPAAPAPVAPTAR